MYSQVILQVLRHVSFKSFSSYSQGILMVILRVILRVILQLFCSEFQVILQAIL